MHEILFRGNRTDTKEWVYGDLIQSCNTNDKWILQISESDLTNTVAVIPETVGQYTNHNIHDQRLYAGDIIRNEKMDDYEDAVEYLVCTFITEWAMFGLLTVDEYHKYNSEGAEALDEYMFWTFPIDDKENEQRRICGNIYSTPELLQSL